MLPQSLCTLAHLLTSTCTDFTLHSGPSETASDQKCFSWLPSSTHFLKHPLLLYCPLLSYSILVITLSFLIRIETAMVENLTVVFISLALGTEPRALDTMGEHSTTRVWVSPEPLTHIIHQNLEQCRLNKHQLNGDFLNMDWVHHISAVQIANCIAECSRLNSFLYIATILICFPQRALISQILKSNSKGPPLVFSLNRPPVFFAYFWKSC